jgi:hypothetical protein
MTKFRINIEEGNGAGLTHKPIDIVFRKTNTGFYLETKQGYCLIDGFGFDDTGIIRIYKCGKGGLSFRKLAEDTNVAKYELEEGD